MRDYRLSYMRYREYIQAGAWIFGGIIALGGVILLILAPVVGDNLFNFLWVIEPFSYIGAILMLAGFGVVVLAYLIPSVLTRYYKANSLEVTVEQRWSEVTQRYFELFDHDLARPLRRILGKERELRAVLRSTGGVTGGVDENGVKDLLDEIERQAPSFRLMISNIRVLVQLEAPAAQRRYEPVEPSHIVRQIVDRYNGVAAESGKEITWWSEPSEFGIVSCDSSAIEHIIVNLVDNAVQYASTQVEVKLTKNPSHFFIRVWDDGPGISSTYLPHLFDHGWTPEVARREEKSSSGLGLYIARTLARNSGGDITVESINEQNSEHHTTFLLVLPLERPQ